MIYTVLACALWVSRALRMTATRSWRRPNLLQCSSTRDNFDKFACDDSLSSTIECQCEFVNHLAGILRCIVHGRHTRRLLRAGALLHRVVDQWCQRIFQIVLQHFGVQRIVGNQFVGSFNGFGAENWHGRALVWHNRLEFVVDNGAVSVIVTGFQDFVGYARSVQETWWQTTDLQFGGKKNYGLRGVFVVVVVAVQPVWNIETHFVGTDDETVTMGALQDSTAFVADAYHFGALGASASIQVVTDETGNTGVNSTAQTYQTQKNIRQGYYSFID